MSDNSNNGTQFPHLRITCATFRHSLVRGGIRTTLASSAELIPAEITPRDLNEAQVRQSFVLPMVVALGWDQSDPYEVFPEERAGGGFIDIRTQIANGDSLIWEIKRTSTSLDLGTEEGKEAAYQAVGYGRTYSHSPYCVVTNFEMAHVLHSYSIPTRDRIFENVVASFNWMEIESGAADEILQNLSKSAIADGSSRIYFDRAVRNKRLIRSRRPLEKRILKDLESWRLGIANEFNRCNRDYGIEQIDHATQTVINRLLFIRCCEDRRLDREMLRPLLTQDSIWRKLTNSVFIYYRASYNSDLFTSDAIADDPELQVSDALLKVVIEQTFNGTGDETHEVYDFSIVPVEVLGAAYEDYLAKRLKRDGQILKLETKPEIAKSGGVCYTPKAVVDEIIQRTLGQLEIRGRSFAPRILDPACGSGTFLIQALRFLFERNRPVPARRSEARPLLSLAEKRRLLEGCIFGADIDERAVEITKLSLLLLLLEGSAEGVLVKAALLPSLQRNIRCGNSLISPTEAVSAIPGVDLNRIRPLDWDSFKLEVDARTGFDAVVGNPPYVRNQVLQEYFPIEAQIYNTNYESARTGNVDLYLPFIEKALTLIRRGGAVGFIVPHRFWTNEYGSNLRSILTRRQVVKEVINFRADQVFEGVTTYTCIVILQPNSNSTFRYFEPSSTNGSTESFLGHLRGGGSQCVADELNYEILNEAKWLLAPQAVRQRIVHLEQSTMQLRHVIDQNIGMFQGLINGADDVYLLERHTEGFFSKELDRYVDLENLFVFPVLKGSVALKQLRVPTTNQFLLYPYRLTSAGDRAELVPLEEIEQLAPLTASYLRSVESVLRARPSLKTKRQRDLDIENNPDLFRVLGPPVSFKWHYTHDDFYKYVRNQAIDCVARPKLIVPSLFREPAFFWDREGGFSLTGSGAGGGGAYAGYFLNEFQPIAGAIVAILSSRVFAEWFSRRGDLFAGYYVGVDESALMSVPLPDLRDSRVRADLPILEALHTQALAIPQTAATNLREEIVSSIDSIVRRQFGLI